MSNIEELDRAYTERVTSLYRRCKDLTGNKYDAQDLLHNSYLRMRNVKTVKMWTSPYMKKIIQSTWMNMNRRMIDGKRTLFQSREVPISDLVRVEDEKDEWDSIGDATAVQYDLDYWLDRQRELQQGYALSTHGAQSDVLRRND